jgi:hypothetical protein
VIAEHNARVGAARRCSLDANPNAAGGAVAFAILANHPVLTQ